jgi:TPR repeat protein
MMGDPTAMRYVAGCYLRGVGGDVNYDEAFRWYRKAVHAGDVKSQANLADMLDEGQGCDRDASEAQTYYRAYRKGVCLGD